MILELAKRDPALKALPFMVGFAIIGGLMARGGNHNLIAGVISSLFVLLAIAVPSVHNHATPFLAALPIRVRDVYAARVLVASLLVWLPVATAGYWIHESSPLPMAAFTTFVLVILESLSIRRARFPARLYVALLVLQGVTAALSRVAVPWLDEGRVTGVTCAFAAAGAIFFWWTWKFSPPSFVMAASERSSVSDPPA